MATAIKLGSQDINRVMVNGPFNGRTDNLVNNMPWSRPAEWMPLPDVATEGITALIGVENSDGNYVGMAITCTGSSTANTRIDWGDGTIDICKGYNQAVTFTAATSLVTQNSHGLPDGSPVVFGTINTTTGITINTIYYVINSTPNTFQLALVAGGPAITLTNNGTGNFSPYAYHQYDYASITDSATSSTTLTVDGMKQCVVTVTPVTGNITGVNLNVKHVKSGLVAGMSVNWLDLKIKGASITSFSLGGTQFIYCSYLESVDISTTIGVFTTMTYMFAGCRSLRNIVRLPDPTGCNNANGMISMFQNCQTLQTIPAFPGPVTAVKSMASMFQGCYSLQSIPPFTGSVADVTSMANMFQNCITLQTIPPFPGSVISVANMTNMFQSCYSLQTIPPFPGSVAKVTSMAGMFQNCGALQTIPPFPGSVISVVNMANMFQNCYSLQYIPPFPGSVESLASMASMFQNCTTLQTIPPFPGSMAKVTSTQSVFNGCSNLKSIPPFPSSLVNVTDMGTMFNSCVNLQTIPAFTGSVEAVNTMGNMFASCLGLKTIPPFPTPTSSVKNVASMFIACGVLRSCPTLDLSYHVAKDRAPSLTTPNWTLGTGWAYGTSPNQLIKTAGTGTAVALSPTATLSALSLASTDIINTTTAHGFQVGDRVQFATITGGLGLTTSGIYKVSATGLTATTFKLTDLFDVAIDFTTNITAGTIARHNMAIIATATYKVVIVVSAASGGNCFYALGGTTGTSNLSAAGTYTDYVIAANTSRLQINTTATAVNITIDSISIEEQVVGTAAFGTCCSLAESNMTGMRRSISYTGCKLSRAGIVNIFNNLGDSGPAGQIIDISSNHGTADLTAADRLIATNKGFVVTG